MEPINSSSPVPVSGIQNPVETEQKSVQTQNESTSSVQQTAREDSVTISSDSANIQANASSTTIQNADEAKQAASRVVDLFQKNPELAATAQGGKLTPEKADAFLAQNLGGQ